MKRISLVAAFVIGLFLVLVPAYVRSEVQSSATIAQQSLPTAAPQGEIDNFVKAKTDTEETDQESSKPASFDQVVKGTKQLKGLFTLYRDEAAGKLYAEIQPEQLNVNYLCTITMESGIGQGGIYGGLPLEDFLFTFRRVGNKLQFVVPNVFFRTRPGDPLQRSVKRSFSDSVLQALPIRSTHPKRKSFLVDLSPLFLSDLPGLSQSLSSMLGSSYSLDAGKSSFGPAQAFPLNVELESNYGFSAGAEGTPPPILSVLPNSKTFNLRVRYSLSRLPSNHNYRPRLADDRIGYFITAYQDFSDDSPRDPFVRYIQRWNLQKKEPKATLSPPEKPIVFWIENTVPLEYRDAVRDGALMWNKAFEQVGFKDAIEVRQMPDDAKWDPADVRYNTIRWLSSFDAGFLGMGPSRVNPLTGEILDADILIDASFARYAKEQYRSLEQSQQLESMPALMKLTGNPSLCSYGMGAYFLKQSMTAKPARDVSRGLKLLGNYDLCYGMEATRQLGIGAMSLSMLHNVTPRSSEMKQFVQSFLRSLIAHEVGHTLGLRHNFRASAMLTPAELNDPAITHQKGLVASVMDYSAVNLAPQGATQGDYFTQTIGPYDEWAIAYGYTPVDALVPQSETRLLEKIAGRAPEPALAYATDEDIYAGLDPLTNPFDLSGDLLTYAPWQMENAQKMWQRLDQSSPIAGESFSDVRLKFDEIFDYYFQYASFLTTYVGGQSFNRFKGGDVAGRLPFEPVPAEKQRQALALLQTHVFDANKFRFSPAFLNKLAPSRWSHWGEEPQIFSLDYPIHDRILLLQTVVLRELLQPDRLARLRDADLKTQSGQAFALPELFNTLQMAIWQDMIKPEDKLKLSSLRRGLQREYLKILTGMVLRTTPAPDDARTLAWYELKQLATALDRVLQRQGKDADTETKAHLEETRDRIAKTLDARLQTQ
ncbi:zinc-dependent metalloprotease [Stenomitos frigidus]|uniref:Peptidase M43 n=1 Tax=Stenomitos frigidus ULC18 TaxID=2107698 RepID=A0A2T1ELH9_9CYAN|nr:zinc-dependent metalloprotease [Stenomitos frigidus]PSB33586.1 peptidase M43 [Stenomitos frigidus ULC18]